MLCHVKMELYRGRLNRSICTGAACVFGMVLCLTAYPAWPAVYDPAARSVTISDGGGALVLHLNLDRKCVMDTVVVRGRKVVDRGAGVVSAVKFGGKWFTSSETITSPEVSVTGNVVMISGIRFGCDDVMVEESWEFTEEQDAVRWRIERTYSDRVQLEDTCFPGWNFTDMATWTGALLDTGGVAWCKLMKSPEASYGVHASSITFWNKEKGDCLRINAIPQPGGKTAVRFTHQPNGVFSCNYTVSGEELQPKYDLRRFLSDKQDVWAPFQVTDEGISVIYSLAALDYDTAYDRGEFKAIDGDAVREICNTVGRIGVIDKGIMGSNGWYSGYAVLHEHWLAQMGLAIDDPCFFDNYALALDWARDHAISPDGRVKSRWAHARGDEIPGTYDRLGFYEAQWGILWDSQPGYVTNVAELFDFTGDIAWLRGQKSACEKVLALALGRDSNNNGLLECMNDSHTEAQGSDWIDVVWAAFENGLINAEMHNALLLWADAEEVLGDGDTSEKYRAAAARIKEAFNRPVSEGGLWNPEKKCYVYWRDKDGSVHGDNFVTPVNLMAAAYDLCGDPARKAAILDQLETAMERENLFFWPLCLYSYQPEEVYKVNWPFPNYENGDIFLAWGQIGVRAYAAYKPDLAVKYVKQVLERYNQDGLAFQRYRRTTQAGEGDDILANNIQPVTGLYRDIYGIQPRYNRLYLDPRITPELVGTRLKYLLRGCAYQILLETGQVAVGANTFMLHAETPFAIDVADNTLEYFIGNSNSQTLAVTCSSGSPLELRIESPSGPLNWQVRTEKGNKTVLNYTVSSLQPGQRYSVALDQDAPQEFVADSTGEITVQHTVTENGLGAGEVRVVIPPQ